MVWPKIKLLDEKAKVPEYKSKTAAGADCYACDPGGDGAYAPLLLIPGARVLVSLGFAVAVPVGYEMQIRPRSGMAYKEGVTVLNAPGTVDSDYRGPVKALLINHSPLPVAINHGDRVCQAVIAPVEQAIFQVVDELDDTERGEGGFGHSGKN